MGPTVTSVTFLDLLEFIGQKTVIVKIDTEGFECKVLTFICKTAVRLLSYWLLFVGPCEFWEISCQKYKHFKNWVLCSLILSFFLKLQLKDKFLFGIASFLKLTN